MIHKKNLYIYTGIYAYDIMMMVTMMMTMMMMMMMMTTTTTMMMMMMMFGCLHTDTDISIKKSRAPHSWPRMPTWCASQISQ